MATMTDAEAAPLTGSPGAPSPQSPSAWWKRALPAFAVVSAAAAALFGPRWSQAAAASSPAAAASPAILAISATAKGGCKKPKGWCNGTATRKDTFYFRDCDGDGVEDPYCEGGELLRFGYISSKDGCKDTWPKGVCHFGRVGNRKTHSTPKQAATNEITIIHFNDVYEISGVLSDGVRMGGFSRSLHMVNEERKRNPNRTFVVFAGDCLSPSVLSDMFKGEQMLDVLNHMELDAASLGNHEFDFGVDVLQQRLSESSFPWLNVNILNEKGELLDRTTRYLIRDVPWSPRWTPDEQQTLRVCFFGVAYDVRITMFQDTEKIGYDDAINASKQAVQYLKTEKKCNVVIPLTHQFSREDCELSKALGEDIDVILGGHDHATEFTSVCGHAPFAKAASNLKSQWIITLWLNDDGQVADVDGNMVSLSDADPFDEALHDKIVDWEEKAEAELLKVVGCFEDRLHAVSHDVRTKETTMGNFATDAVKHFHGTDIALINGGCLRGDKEYPSGDIQKKTVIEFHPFGNCIAKIYANGKELKNAINNNLNCVEDSCGDFVTVSGVKYEFDSRKPKGERLLKLMLPDGTEVSDDANFTVAISDYMLNNSPLKNNKLYKMTTLNDAVPMVQAFEAEIVNAGKDCLHVELEGRITNVADGAR